MSVLEAELTGGREWSRVGDSFEVTKKPRAINRSAYSEIPFAAMEAIPQGGGYAANYVMKSPQAIASGTYFEKGDILVAKITPSFENGKQALASDLPAAFGYATTEVIPLHPRDPKCDSRLLFFYLLHPDVRHYVAGRMEGSTGRQRIPEGVLLDLPFPSFTADEQFAMGDALEALQRARALEIRAENRAKQLKNATLQALFTRGLIVGEENESEIGHIQSSWKLRSVLELCQIWSGGTPKKSVSEYWGGEIPWASGKDLKSPCLDDTIDHVTEEGVTSGSRMAPAGAVLLLVRGMGLAKDLPVASINRPMAFNQDIKALVSRGEFSGQFIRSAIYARKDRLLSQIVPSAHGTMTLNLSDIENFKVPCPTNPDEAGKVVEILATLDRKIDLHQRKRAVIDDLFTAVLHNLITGEIRVADLCTSALSSKSAEVQV